MLRRPLTTFLLERTVKRHQKLLSSCDPSSNSTLLLGSMLAVQLLLPLSKTLQLREIDYVMAMPEVSDLNSLFKSK